jgi:hypothetical protein
VQREVDDSKRNQPSLNEIKNSLESTLSEIDRLHHSQTAIKNEISQTMVNLTQDRVDRPSSSFDSSKS